jgi:hypothetical protein
MKAGFTTEHTEITEKGNGDKEISGIKGIEKKKCAGGANKTISPIYLLTPLISFSLNFFLCALCVLCGSFLNFILLPLPTS